MSSRLPETELANWSFLSSANKRKALEKHVQPKKIVGTYEPFRSVLADAVNKQLPLFADLEQPATPWDAIERRIRSKCRSIETLKMNLEIAQATHDYAEREKLVAVPIDVTSLAFGVGHLYQFGLPLLMRYPDRIANVFLDLRRTNSLSHDGRDWVFAAMHERFRVAYPDLASANLEIWRYRGNAQRSIVAISCGDINITYNDLVADARETYAIYNDVLIGDREEKRRGTGGTGSLL